MLHCPTCRTSLPRSALLLARAPSFKWQRESMRFRLRCPACGDSIGLERSASRLFFLLWLCPLPLLAGLTSAAGPLHVWLVVALPVAWLLLFPPFWLGRVGLVSFGPRT